MMRSTRSVWSRFGLVLDIDGVLIRGKTPLPHTKSALQLLTTTSKEIPFVYLTNGGGVTERDKAQELTKRIGLPINEKHVILSHTPYRQYLPQYENQYILIIGGTKCLHVAQSYGFKHAITSSILHEAYPEIYPLSLPSRSTSTLHSTNPTLPPLNLIKAAFIFAESDNWGLDIQILSDLANIIPNFPIYACNTDLVYNSNHPHPRYTQGAFLHALRSTYQTYTKRNLSIHYCGKPYPIQYQYAEKILQDMNPEAPLVRYYAIGDNPASDIRGAKMAGRQWKSILVKTGIYQDSHELEEEEIPDFYEENILTAIQRIFVLEGISMHP